MTESYRRLRIREVLGSIVTHTDEIGDETIEDALDDIEDIIEEEQG